MRKKIIVLTGLLLAGCVLNVSAQNPAASPAPTPDLEERMNKVEGSIDQMLQILQTMQQSQGANAAPAATTNTNPPPAAAAAPATPQQQSAPAQLKTQPGAILEVWTLPPGFQGDAPTGRSIGAFIDKGPYFEMANFASQKEFEGMRSNHVALKWSGIFNAKEAGVYVFSIEMNKNGTSWIAQNGYNDSGPWVAELSLSDQAVFRESPAIDHYRNLVHSSSGEVELQPGLYGLSLLTFVKPQRPVIGSWDYSTLKLAVKVRGPSDNLPVPLSAEIFMHKAE
jgi:hypothetical protein